VQLIQETPVHQIIDFVTANPLYGVGLALLLVFLIFSLVKKAVKLVVIAVLLNVGYGYYLHDMAQTASDKAARAVEDAAEQASRAAGQAGDMLRLK
jgi:Fe2+ transport system protein B